VGDTLKFVVNWGTEDEPLEAVALFSCALSYDGFQIDPQSAITVEGGDSSWYVGNSSFTYEAHIDTGLRKIDLEVLLPTDSLRSGHGFCVSIGGPIVVVDDVVARKGILAEESTVHWHCWYDVQRRKLGKKRPVNSGMFIREGITAEGKPLRKFIFIR
jgi:hypothetical protein